MTSKTTMTATKHIDVNITVERVRVKMGMTTDDGRPIPKEVRVDICNTIARTMSKVLGTAVVVDFDLTYVGSTAQQLSETVH